MKQLLKIKLYHIQVLLLGIVTLIEAPYIKVIFGSYYIVQFFIFALSFFLFVIQIKKEKIKLKLNHPFSLLLCYCMIVGVSTILNGSSIYTFVNEFYKIVAFSLAIYLVRSDDELISILNIWRSLLLIMLVIDIITMFLYPNGLYRTVHETETYTNCWFLGYKTNRMLYTLPLIFIDSYILLSKRKKIRFGNILIYAMTLYDIINSSATMGTIVISVYLIGFISLYMMKTNNINKNLLYRAMINYKIYGIVYALIFVTVVVFQSNGFIRNIAATFFSKGLDYNNRIPIWTRCLQSIASKPIFGHGMLTSSDYVRITLFAVNPHNMLLTILLTGGLLGLIVFIAYHLMSLKNAAHNKQNAMMIFGIYVVFLLGITSSTLVYSPYVFAVITILSLKEVKKG